MKKVIRITSLLLAVAMLAISLCSCQELDDAKKNRAVYANADHTEIEFRGNTYRMMQLNKFDFILKNNDTGYRVTEEDIPVLLSSWYGKSVTLNSNQTVIAVESPYTGTTDATADEAAYDINASYRSDYTYYVREDKYSAVQAALKSASLDRYYIEFYPIEGTDIQQQMISDKLTAVVNKALKASDTEKVSYQALNPYNYDMQVIDLYVCDSEMILTNRNIDYRLIEDGGHYYFWDGNLTGGNVFYPLSKEDGALVKQLMQQYPDAMMYDNISYSFDFNADAAGKTPYDDGDVTGSGDSSTIVF